MRTHSQATPVVLKEAGNMELDEQYTHANAFSLKFGLLAQKLNNRFINPFAPQVAGN